MRTTLTLDDDVAEKLMAEQHRRGCSFKEIVNEILRVGLNTRRELKKTGRFRVEPKAMGYRADLNFDNIQELLDQAEGPDRRW
ncbi:MAG TPA: DUF2191 domain-containing protein [Blastocatellia bacterium]|nr:DUF2191 domain-containing protein [Blastocatellia bacterium]